MHIRTLAAALAVAVAVTLPLAGVAAGAADRDCADFSSQAEAQAAFDARPGDPERLDRNGDGEACEEQFADTTPSPSPSPTPSSSSTPSPSPSPSDKPQGQVRDVPRGGVETGDGSTAPTSG